MISAASKSVVGALTEYRCYDTMNGLYALPEGIMLDRTQLESQTPAEYVDQLFLRVATMQALELTEFEEHLLKSISLFNPGTRSKNPKKAFPQDAYRPLVDRKGRGCHPGGCHPLPSWGRSAFLCLRMEPPQGWQRMAPLKDSTPLPDKDGTPC